MIAATDAVSRMNFLRRWAVVGDQHFVTGLQDFADHRGEHRQLAVAGAFLADDHDILARRQCYRPGKLADPQLGTLQVGDQRERPAEPGLGLAHEARAFSVLVVAPVREVEPRRVHAGLDQPADALSRAADGADRGDDLRSPRGVRSHRS